MRVSVIIPALNEAARVGAAIESAWNSGADEVLVADGGSTDGTRAIAERLAAVVVESPRGRAEQQNAASRAARGDLLLFLHADSWLGVDCIQQITDAMATRPDRFWGAMRQRIDHSHCKYRLLEWGNVMRARYWGLAYGDQGLFFRRSFFEQLGRFPNVVFLEDLLLARRARRIAWPVLLVGPIHVDARRWERHGVVIQTARNWSILAAFSIGVSPAKLARWYRRHDLDRS